MWGERRRQSVCTVTRAVISQPSQARKQTLPCSNAATGKRGKTPFAHCGSVEVSGMGLGSRQVCYRKGWRLVGNNAEMKGPSAINPEVKSL